jgi:hypothetical protein
VLDDAPVDLGCVEESGKDWGSGVDVESEKGLTGDQSPDHFATPFDKYGIPPLPVQGPNSISATRSRVPVPPKPVPSCKKRLAVFSGKMLDWIVPMPCASVPSLVGWLIRSASNSADHSESLKFAGRQRHRLLAMRFSFVGAIG